MNRNFQENDIVKRIEGNKEEMRVVKYYTDEQVLRSLIDQIQYDPIETDILICQLPNGKTIRIKQDLVEFVRKF